MTSLPGSLAVIVVTARLDCAGCSQRLGRVNGQWRSVGCGAILRSGQITGWKANVEIRDADGLIGVGDVVFDRARLVLEVDGLAFHTTPEQFQRDRERQNRLVAAGWTVLRFTWRDLTTRPAYVLASVRRVLHSLSSEQS